MQFDAFVEVPFGAGQIVSVEWDFEGTAEYPLQEEGLDGAADRLRAVGHPHLRPRRAPTSRPCG